MPAKTREVFRDTRDYDTTQLKASHARNMHRDYSAHFFRWSFARRFINEHDHVLEVGCGQEKPLANILTRAMTPHCASYTGTDLNKLKPSAHQRLTLLGEFNFVERWKEVQKLRPKGYDVVVHYEVIEHMKLEHGKKMLKACFEVLRPGGVMLMSTPCYDGKRHAANHIHEYTVPELQALTEKAGFKVERRFGTFMDIKHIGKVAVGKGSEKERDAVIYVRDALAEYFDNDAISNIFGPLYPDHARNNLWVCQRPK